MDYYQKNVEFFMNQHYHNEKKTCITQSKMFEDQYFRPESESLFIGQKNCSGIEWKRPKDLCNDPHLTVGGTSSMDLTSGEYGSPSFIAACSVLSNYQDLWQRVVPDLSNQEWNSNHPTDYVGMFRFRFWRFGCWYEVVIDDMLPVKDGELFGIRSTDKNEFWSALLEKAYAKLVGCYEMLHLLDAGSILQDLTGGIVQPTIMRNMVSDAEQKNKLYEDLTDTSTSGISMLTCWMTPETKEEMGTETTEGLVFGQVYAVNAMKEIKLGTGVLAFFKSDKIRMVRLRNPTGSTEWSGPWSDNSPEWKEIRSSQKTKMGLTFDGDGEFWMAFDDFCKYFTDLSVCRILHTARLLRETWRESCVTGMWKLDSVPTVNQAGGSLHLSRLTFLQNPQYRFDIPDNNASTVLIQLQQRERRIHAKSPQRAIHTIGFHIVKIEANRIYRLHKLIEPGTDYGYQQIRSVFAKVTLDKGRYAIIPTTEGKNLEGEFLLRIYAETNINFSPLDTDYPEKTCWAFCFGYPVRVTTTKVVRGINCKKPDGKVTNVFVTIGCEGELVKSKTFKASADAKFDTGAIFYRKKEETSIVYSVYSDGVCCDSFLGQGSLPGTVDASANAVEVPLFGRGNMEGKRMPGSLVVNIETNDDIHAL